MAAHEYDAEPVCCWKMENSNDSAGSAAPASTCPRWASRILLEAAAVRARAAAVTSAETGMRMDESALSASSARLAAGLPYRGRSSV